MENVKENKMGTMPMTKLILTMSLPAIFSMTIMAMYNVVDSIFIGQYSQEGLNATSLAYPLQMLLIAVAVGTGVGINSLVSRRLGEKNFKERSCNPRSAVKFFQLRNLSCPRYCDFKTFYDALYNQRKYHRIRYTVPYSGSLLFALCDYRSYNRKNFAGYGQYDFSDVVSAHGCGN